MDELTLTSILRQKGINLREGSIDERSLNFARALVVAIPPRSSSDRVAFRNFVRWLTHQCYSGRFEDETIFRRVLPPSL